MRDLRIPVAAFVAVLLLGAAAPPAAAATTGTPTNATPTTAAPPSASTFREDEMNWRKNRDTRLRSENGWLTLVGLHWLAPGENRFGSDHYPVLGTFSRRNQ